MFNSILSALPAPAPGPCVLQETKGRTFNSDLVRKVVLADHNAGLTAFLLPDILRKIPGLSGTSPFSSGFDGAQVLELSLDRALSELATGAHALPVTATASQPFAVHWSPSGHVPALVLNTTWVEMGYRVAFAPFPLRDVGDGALYSFEDAIFRGSPLVKAATLLQAGVISTRTSSSWQLADLEVSTRRRGETTTAVERRTWNFVDGGYADNTGTMTAYDIFNALRRYIEEAKLPIDLRLIALSEEELERQHDGTRYTDAIAPIRALLNIRKRGLVEVVSKFAQRDLELDRNLEAHVSARSGKHSELLVMRLNQEAYPLTLGWTISEYRNSTIRLQLGMPELCRAGASSKDEAKDTILGNSCVQREIFTLLGAKM